MSSELEIHPVLRKALRPLVRLALRGGMRLQGLVQALKEALVDVAREELQSERQSVSRISVMTGIYRKEVQSILETPKQPRIPLVTKVIGQWLNDPRFYKTPGRARDLCCSGKGSEFVELIQSVDREVNPYAVLFELERLKLISIDGGVVRLESLEAIPAKTLVEVFNLLADDLEDLSEVVFNNLMQESEVPQLHLKTSYDDIALEHLPEIRLWLLQEGAAFHRRARDYISQFDRDLNPLLKSKPGGARVSVGTFSLIPEE
jgi:hypothetical protein